MKRILVTGGTGYIGSITVRKLMEEGYEVVVLDNLKYGHRQSVSCKLVIGDLIDSNLLRNELIEHFDAVIHFAAYALAGESMINPSKYFTGNIQGGVNLLDFMVERNIKKIIFSSSCSTYGMPLKVPVDENEKKEPESVYGESKYIFERILKWYDKIYGIKHVNLRYFNAAGAAMDGLLGEMHYPETHIIPLAIKAALGELPYFTLYGKDYDTPDGTCERDYIHVEDLAQAHFQALKKINTLITSDSFNLGTGKSYSNLEVIKMIKQIGGRDFQVKIENRRQGDPARVLADNKKAKKVLGFSPKYSDLETIIRTAWDWHTKLRKS